MGYIDLELIKRSSGNQAVAINAPTGVDFHITEHGSDVLWSLMCVFIVVSLIIGGLMFRKPASERVFYFTSIIPTILIALTYFTMASNLGWTPIEAEFNHVQTDDQSEVPGLRQIFYARYIGWFLAFPFVILNLGFLSRTPWGQIAFNIIFTEIYVVLMLIGALVKSTYKWGFWTFAVSSYIFVVILLFTTSLRLAFKVGKDCYFYYNIAASIVTFIWFLYPLAFGLSEGGNVIQPDSEVTFYAILDGILFGIYPVAFLVATNDFTLERLGLLTPEFQVIPNEKSGLSTASHRASGETAVSRSASGLRSPTPASGASPAPASPTP